MKILVVDDEPYILSMMYTILAGEGHEVITAKGAEEAWDLCGGGIPGINLIISDVNMPGTNGRELAARIVRLPQPIPVILMSGYPPDPSPIGEGHRENQVAFLNKPFRPGELLAKVAQCAQVDCVRSHNA